MMAASIADYLRFRRRHEVVRPEMANGGAPVGHGRASPECWLTFREGRDCIP